jgi:hypothetical protein
MANIVEMLFGCWHRNCSFPITAKVGARRQPAAQVTGTYIVCLDCGKEFPYDWTEMRIVTPGNERKRARAAAGLEPVEGFAAGNTRAA